MEQPWQEDQHGQPEHAPVEARHRGPGEAPPHRIQPAEEQLTEDGTCDEAGRRWRCLEHDAHARAPARMQRRTDGLDGGRARMASAAPGGAACDGPSCRSSRQRHVCERARGVGGWPDVGVAANRLPLPDDGRRTLVLTQGRRDRSRTGPGAVWQRAVGQVERRGRRRDGVRVESAHRCGHRRQDIVDQDPGGAEA